MNSKGKTAVSGSSVGADVKQPLCNKHSKIIADLPMQGNLQAMISDGMDAEN